MNPKQPPNKPERVGDMKNLWAAPPAKNKGRYIHTSGVPAPVDAGPEI